MIRWNNDYNHGAHPAVLDALRRTNGESYGGYGLDEWCRKAADEIRKYLGGSGAAANAEIHFLTGGTQANLTMIAAALRPYQSVICADFGHINVHETGAVENTGHKIQQVKGKNGKISAEQIASEAELYRSSGIKEHITQPKMVFLSFPTEYGMIYSGQELSDISDVCREYGLYLYIDGARMGYGLGSCKCDVTLADVAALADAFYIGGTKCGALLGEAMVIMNNELKSHFRSYIKQNGGMIAKGWLLGLQFYTLFENGLYFSITKQADEKAMEIREAFEKKGVPLYMESDTNQQFVLLTGEQMKKLEKKHIFEYQFQTEELRHCVRFCTSWSTRQEEVEELKRDIDAM